VHAVDDGFKPFAGFVRTVGLVDEEKPAASGSYFSKTWVSPLCIWSGSANRCPNKKPF